MAVGIPTFLKILLNIFPIWKFDFNYLTFNYIKTYNNKSRYFYSNLVKLFSIAFIYLVLNLNSVLNTTTYTKIILFRYILANKMLTVGA